MIITVELIRFQLFLFQIKFLLLPRYTRLHLQSFRIPATLPCILWKLLFHISLGVFLLLIGSKPQREFGCTCRTFGTTIAKLLQADLRPRCRGSSTTAWWRDSCKSLAGTSWSTGQRFLNSTVASCIRPSSARPLTLNQFFLKKRRCVWTYCVSVQ